MTKKKQETVLLVLTAAFLVLVSIVSLLYYGRLDLTESKVFTISDTSKNLFKEIPEQVTITYYVSQRLAKLSPIPGQIEDLLREYAAHGRGKIRVDVQDPSKGNLGREIEKLGIVPQQIQLMEKNEQTVAVVHTGIVLSHLDSREVLPVVFDVTTLEYDLTLRIKKLVKGESLSVGFLFGRKESSFQADHQILANHLSRSYAVKEVKRGEEVPRDLSALFVLGGKDLDEYDLYPVDQHLMRGGRVLFAVDGVEVAVQANLKATPLKDLPISRMLAAYGAGVNTDLVMDSHSKRIPVRKSAGMMTIQSLEKYPPWIAVQGSGFSRKNPITARLSGLDLLWPSSLDLKERPGVKTEVLASSSADSWVLRDRFMTSPYEAPAFKAFASDTKGRYPLAAALSGTFESYFKGRPVPAREGEKSAWADPIQASPETRIVVIGDADCASDLVRYSDSGYNPSFFENVSDWLASDEALSSIRTRTARDLRLNLKEDPATKAAVILFAEILNVGVVPLAVLLFGLVRAFRRKEEIHEL